MNQNSEHISVFREKQGRCTFGYHRGTRIRIWRWNASHPGNGGVDSGKCGGPLDQLSCYEREKLPFGLLKRARSHCRIYIEWFEFFGQNCNVIRVKRRKLRHRWSEHSGIDERVSPISFLILVRHCCNEFVILSVIMQCSYAA